MSEIVFFRSTSSRTLQTKLSVRDYVSWHSDFFSVPLLHLCSLVAWKLKKGKSRTSVVVLTLKIESREWSLNSITFCLRSPLYRSRSVLLNIQLGTSSSSGQLEGPGLCWNVLLKTRRISQRNSKGVKIPLPSVKDSFV